MIKVLLPKIYTPTDYEEDIYYKWESSGFLNPNQVRLDDQVRLGGSKKQKAFSIVLPPPNVTGKLHIGHAAMLAYQDLMIRYHRLKGDRALWLPGMDHAAIATQSVVEKELNLEGKTRYDLGREKFLARVNNFVEKAKVTIRNQLKAMGASLDWSRECFTLDEKRSLAVRTAFKKMYDDGLIYRGDRVVNWCPKCQSTLSDDEVEYEETKGQLYYIKYGPITIATTRPETKLGDSGVAVNPKDARYKSFIGQTLTIDLASHKIKVKVFADRAVDINFGTGAIGVTPAHSQQDFDWAQKYQLEIIKVINENGLMTENAGKYQGLTVMDCRQKFVHDLQQAGLVEKIEEYTNNLSICYRCDSPIEPLPSQQWFVAVNKEVLGRGKSLKELASEVVKKGEIKIIPERFNKTYFQWLDNLRDWCISRQIWYGHRIPVWYCGEATRSMKRLGFAGDVVTQVFASKTRTYRLRDHGFRVGDRVAFEDSSTRKIFGYGTITEVKVTTVGEIDLKDSKHWKVYKKCEDLISALKRHHPKEEITNNTTVWVYTYKFNKIIPKRDCGMVIVSAEKPLVCPICGSRELIQDLDTLDTWFSSALWTFSTLGWPASVKTTAGRPQKIADLKTFHPTSVMETGYDILFFWVARMIMMSLYLMEEKPFETVYLHGLIRTKTGEKMSKSKPETCIDPLEMIKKFGADALRLALIIGSAPGNDVRLYEEKIAGYRNFVNKLWNISRYILSSVGKVQAITQDPRPKTLADYWILSELNQIISSTTKNIEEFKFSQAGEELYEFTWNKLADWYLEIAKIEVGKEEILLYILEKLLILWHPLCPYVTEVLWEEFKTKELLMVQKWPEVEGRRSQACPGFLASARQARDKGRVRKEFALIQEIITSIRNTRTENKIAPKKIYSCSIKSKYQKFINENQKIIEGLAKVRITPKCLGVPIHLSHSEIILDISQNKEVKKQQAKEIINLKRYIEIQERKLANQEFIKKAPKLVVEQEKEKLKQAENKLNKLLS